ncbi:hypothetical protein BV898_18457 [Hypsibius exemplaris]|uniref:Uncharacterized protein n=1 Tax=Hypsibius exemplaris TaxID=2072580 RepID=A0A9X6RNH4_HYPEX|nr:hypothetical protein BV898_18457 [Hypsibius exemplaris]
MPVRRHIYRSWGFAGNSSYIEKRLPKSLLTNNITDASQVIGTDSENPPPTDGHGNGRNDQGKHVVKYSLNKRNRWRLIDTLPTVSDDSDLALKQSEEGLPVTCVVRRVEWCSDYKVRHLDSHGRGNREDHYDAFARNVARVSSTAFPPSSSSRKKKPNGSPSKTWKNTATLSSLLVNGLKPSDGTLEQVKQRPLKRQSLRGTSRVVNRATLKPEKPAAASASTAASTCAVVPEGSPPSGMAVITEGVVYEIGLMQDYYWKDGLWSNSVGRKTKSRAKSREWRRFLPVSHGDKFGVEIADSLATERDRGDGMTDSIGETDGPTSRRAGQPRKWTIGELIEKSDKPRKVRTLAAGRNLPDGDWVDVGLEVQGHGEDEDSWDWKTDEEEGDGERSYDYCTSGDEGDGEDTNGDSVYDDFALN